MVTDLIRSTGQHRWTWRDRITTRIDLIPLAVVVAFWGVVVAMAGFLAGWVWGRAI